MVVVMVFELTDNKLILLDGEEEVGYILYDEHDTHYVVTYIYVKPEYRGQSLANKLVDEFVRIAKEKELKIVPICSVTNRLINRKYPEMILD